MKNPVVRLDGDRTIEALAGFVVAFEPG